MSRDRPSPAPRGGRPSPAVYRRRRIVALLILVVLLAAVVWGVMQLVGRLGADDGAAADTPATTSPTTDAPAPQDADPEACLAVDVDIDLVLDPESPTAGSPVDFGLTLVNSGEMPCLLDVAPDALVATVTSGSDTVWTSAHCAGDVEDALLLDTGAEHATTVRWSGSRSAADCPGGQPMAGAGTYRVTVGIGGPSEGDENTVFTLG